MGHAKTVFLVNDQKAEVFKNDIFRQEPVRSDEDVDIALWEFFEDFFDFLRFFFSFSLKILIASFSTIVMDQ